MLQVHRRISTPEALAWTEQTRGMFGGVYGEYAFGELGDRCFAMRIRRLSARAGPLAGIRVLDLATVIAGPGAARYLADFGADVLKVERPGDGRQHPRAWACPTPPTARRSTGSSSSRNKRCTTVDLKTDDGRATILRLVDDAHVLVENFRPGTLERLGLGPDVLLERNPSLVILRVTGFGQDGPYAGRPGFATIAEAMSGFAAINGEPDGGPLLPPIALTDEVTALVGAFATMVALWSGVGQVVDVNLLESLFQCMGPLPGAFAATGYLQPRLGSGIPYSVPRGTWRCADGHWVAVSTSAESVAARVMELIGFGDRADLQTFNGRIAARDEIDARMADVLRRPPAGRGARRVRGGPGGRRARSTTWPTSPPTRTTPPAARSSRSTACRCRASSPACRPTPGAVRWAGRALDADEPEWVPPG